MKIQRVYCTDRKMHFLELVNDRGDLILELYFAISWTNLTGKNRKVI